jgi:site-specific DNA-methyltransferase (adenine-specific)
MDPIKHRRKTDVPSDEWETPSGLFRYWNRIFNFKLDAAASDENALCPEYFTKEDDALSVSWNGFGAVWVNPPYSQKAGPLLKWCEKAYQSSYEGSLVVMLLKCDTSTATWRFCQENGTVITLPKRVVHQYKGEPQNTPPWGSMIVIFWPETMRWCRYGF